MSDFSDLDVGSLSPNSEDPWALAKGEIPLGTDKDTFLSRMKVIFGDSLKIGEGGAYFTVDSIVDNYNLPVRIFLQRKMSDYP